MKKIFLFLSAGAFFFASCDKVENPYPAEEDQGDYSLYPGGDSATYWSTDGPVFGANTNTLRNVMIEDFTGHKCNSCPIAADTAKSIHEDYPTRIFVASIHAGPNGLGGFQQVDPPIYSTDWTNPDGLDIGFHFGNITGSQFIGNPSGTVSRILKNGQHTQSPYDWRNSSVTTLSTALKVNIQSAANYYATTRGMFLHTEVDVLDQSIADDLYTVVYLIEDSIIGAQKFPTTDSLNYVHREIMRDCIQSGWQGKQLTAANEVAPNKYRFDYIFELPAQYDADNMHLLIYVRNAITEEIYHVVKQKFID